MAQPVVAGAANPWAMADAPADGPAGVAVAQGLPAAAEGAQPPAAADGQAPPGFTLPGLGVLSTQEVLERAERYVSVTPTASFGLTVLCEMLLVLHVALILLDICRWPKESVSGPTPLKRSWSRSG
jgi:hypothetical protein